ncbi:MAG: hypothetical protein C9356_10200 [Oleiphilus sp.]|nr:MAG: hypothetical protein C9356_10200 [Oleiphilus sp.]
MGSAMDILIDAVQKMSLARDLNSTQKLVVHTAQKLVNADTVSFVVADKAFVYGHLADVPAFEKIATSVTSNCISNRGNDSASLICIEDTQRDNRFTESLYEKMDIRAFVICPLGDSHPNAAIGLYWTTPYAPTQAQMQSLQLLACAALANLDNIDLVNELNNKVMERTSSLLEAQQEAEKANKFKSRFLSAASHDLRQPLQYLNAQCGILKRQQPSAEQLASLNKMLASIAGMNGLLDALLNLNQLESGQLNPELQDLNLGTLLSELRNEFAEIAENKGLGLNIHETTLTVHSDPILLRQMLRNLIGNALKYTPQGHVGVRCEQSEDVVSIIISDTGPGIPVNKQSEIFEPFFRLTQHRHHKGGFGMGLAIVKSLAELLMHPINIISEEASGTTFVIEVPGNAETSNSLDIAAEETVQIENDNRPTILYLEDDEDILEAVQTLLDLEGYKVLSAEESLEAVKLIKSEGAVPDLVITDNRLANGDNGLDVVAQIRSEFNNSIPAIMLTGYTEKSLHVKALETVQKVLCKPVDADVLIKEVRHFV